MDVFHYILDEVANLLELRKVGLIMWHFLNNFQAIYHRPTFTLCLGRNRYITCEARTPKKKPHSSTSFFISLFICTVSNNNIVFICTVSTEIVLYVYCVWDFQLESLQQVLVGLSPFAPLVYLPFIVWYIF